MGAIYWNDDLGCEGIVDSSPRGHIIRMLLKGLGICAAAFCACWRKGCAKTRPVRYSIQVPVLHNGLKGSIVNGQDKSIQHDSDYG